MSLTEREKRLLGGLKKCEQLLLSHGDPFRGDDWQAMQDIRALIAECESGSAITAEQLGWIMPRLIVARRAEYLPFLNTAMGKFEINTPLRAAAFLAQIAHESGEFRWLEEIWGPTAQQKKYEPPSDLAAKLGNTEKGDGYRYRGRGVIMITGRANYRKYGALLGVDLEANPDLAATPEYAFQIAGAYWKENGLNELADLGTSDGFKRITLRINGGYTDLVERERYYAAAKEALGVGK